MKSCAPSNEEIQSANEEMQSTNEELETAKEELQSTNEELATVNDELENRNVELAAANNDINNMLASINLPILMLGNDLRIRQFTPQAERLLNLIGSDLGRPIGNIKPNIEIPDLEAQVRRVIENLEVKSLELQDNAGHWYAVRLRPYKTLDHRIDGAVISFVDIDEIKDAEAPAREPGAGTAAGGPGARLDGRRHHPGVRRRHPGLEPDRRTGLRLPGAAGLGAQHP